MKRDFKALGLFMLVVLACILSAAIPAGMRLRAMNKPEPTPTPAPERSAAWHERRMAEREEHIRRNRKPTLEERVDKLERSLLVRPASSLPKDQQAAQRANGEAPLWEGGR